jgi:hypothetical protein
VGNLASPSSVTPRTLSPDASQFGCHAPRIQRNRFSEVQTHKENLKSIMSRPQAEEMEGVEMTSTEKQIPPLLTEEEKRILNVYDRLEELQLDIALLKAQGVLSQGELSLFWEQVIVIKAYKL